MSAPTPFEGLEAAPIRKYAGAAAVLALVGGVAGVMAVISNGASSSSSSSSSVATQMELETVSYDDFAIEMVTGNEYGYSTNIGKDYPWLSDRSVVEPYKYTTLAAVYDTKTFGNKLSFNWKITSPGSDSTSSTFSGQSVRNTFTAMGNHAVTIVAFGEDGAKIGEFSKSAHCVYVKREVRALTEEDRENFLDAMYTMWSVGTKKGRTLYGNDFTGMDRYTSVHADQATGDIKCDKWHEGSGFLTHHLALSTSFEQSLRAVDKRTTTPYWDFSIEGEQLLKAGLGPKSITRFSAMFTDQWFGSTDDLSHVQDSRWAHSPSQLQVKKTGTKNSYGIIRAPWNNVNDRELVRHMSDVCGLEPVNKPIPTCATHYKVMNVTTLAQFLVSIAGYGHGPMHVNAGGVFGACTGAMKGLYSKYADTMSEVWTMKSLSEAIKAKTGEDFGWHSSAEFTMEMMVQKYIHLEYFHIYRTLWRSQTCAVDGKSAALTCPDSCDADTPESECLCTCAGVEDPDTFDWENLEPCMYASSTSKNIFQTVGSEEFRKDVVTTFCSAGVKEGEMLESASPGDPLFWMIHPLLDRMLVAKRLAAATEMNFGTFGRYFKFKDESWLDYSYYTTDEYTCEGHGMYDDVLENLPLPAHMIALGDANGDGVLNNIEFYDLLDPTAGDGASYIYDHFHWDHCLVNDQQGEVAFSTGYLDGTVTDEDSAETSMTFSGGVNPSVWGGASYSDIKGTSKKSSSSSDDDASSAAAATTESLAAAPMPQGVTPNAMTTVEHRAAKLAGLKPGKSLAKEARLSGSATDYRKVEAILDANTKA